jgi:hypothetical protein
MMRALAVAAGLVLLAGCVGAPPAARDYYGDPDGIVDDGGGDACMPASDADPGFEEGCAPAGASAYPDYPGYVMPGWGVGAGWYDPWFPPRGLLRRALLRIVFRRWRVAAMELAGFWHRLRLLPLVRRRCIPPCAIAAQRAGQPGCPIGSGP